MASRTLQQQVRAREMEYERQQAQKLKEKKEKKRQKLVNRLNKLWREEQEARIAELAEECALALRCIGQSHVAAALFVEKQEALKMERIRQAKINQHRESSRFKIALQKERVRRKLESDPIEVAKRRKNVKEFAAQWERSLGRFSSHNAKFRLLSRHLSSGVPRGCFAEQKEAFTLLQPSDYKHTFLHSRLFINTDDGGFSSKYNEMDAWKAAEIHRQLMNSYRIMQMEIRNVMDKRKALRGQVAGSKLMIEKKLQLLEHENLAIKKAEKEIKWNTSRHQGADTVSKVQPQGADEPLFELLKANGRDVPDKTSGNIDQSSDKEEKPTIIICGNEQTLHILASGENDENSAEKVETVSHCTTSIVCCKEDIKVCLNRDSVDLCSEVTEKPCQKKSRKLLRKALPCKIEKIADQGQNQQSSAKTRESSNVSDPCHKNLVSESIKMRSTSTEGKMKENKRVDHSQSGAKVKSTKRGAGIKSILQSHDDTTWPEDRKKKPESQAITKVVKFK